MKRKTGLKFIGFHNSSKNLEDGSFEGHLESYPEYFLEIINNLPENLRDEINYQIEINNETAEYPINLKSLPKDYGATVNYIDPLKENYDDDDFPYEFEDDYDEKSEKFDYSHI